MVTRQSIWPVDTCQGAGLEPYPSGWIRILFKLYRKPGSDSLGSSFFPPVPPPRSRRHCFGEMAMQRLHPLLYRQHTHAIGRPTPGTPRPHRFHSPLEPSVRVSERVHKKVWRTHFWGPHWPIPPFGHGICTTLLVQRSPRVGKTFSFLLVTSRSSP